MYANLCGLHWQSMQAAPSLSWEHFPMIRSKHKLSCDVTVMRRSIRQIEQGHGREAEMFFDELRAELKTRKKSQSKQGPRRSQKK